MYGQDRVYKKVEIIGVSKNSIEDAIQSALSTLFEMRTSSIVPLKK